MLYDARLASQFADAMLQRGIYVIGFSYPVVPKGQVCLAVLCGGGKVCARQLTACVCVVFCAASRRVFEHK